ncbi:MAG TPA: hypothetical protein VFU31_25320 [Candidatus Binatia bacterium]|nr:hypothetical protein [Candidatus Binatia bacterium]
MTATRGMPSGRCPVVSALQTRLDFMAKELPEARTADARRFVDDRFIRELDESGFFVRCRVRSDYP